MIWHVRRQPLAARVAVRGHLALARCPHLAASAADSAATAAPTLTCATATATVTVTSTATATAPRPWLPVAGGRLRACTAAARRSRVSSGRPTPGCGTCPTGWRSGRREHSPGAQRACMVGARGGRGCTGGATRSGSGCGCGCGRARGLRPDVAARRDHGFVIVISVGKSINAPPGRAAAAGGAPVWAARARLFGRPDCSDSQARVRVCELSDLVLRKLDRSLGLVNCLVFLRRTLQARLQLVRGRHITRDV